jgi:hypothetical protein
MTKTNLNSAQAHILAKVVRGEVPYGDGRSRNALKTRGFVVTNPYRVTEEGKIALQKWISKHIELDKLSPNMQKLWGATIAKLLE